ncbi:1-phosphofructokinase [Bacillus alkalisoli]|uniref:1-phosphofructokinase n=1 Tax=Bacillus alkalisoli TaxID=2011008 RepID=UPI000C2318E0|nr:1-phosphofructokinase [Bacillus alkalisoli]
MIYTVTLNPSIDYVMKVDLFQEGTVNRAQEVMYYPGGKGINVSRVLTRLGVPNTALGFTAGFTGEFIKEKMLEEDIKERFVEVAGKTRINVKLKAESETEINGAGPIVNEEGMELFLRQFARITEGDVVVLAGSIPETMKSTMYVDLIKKCALKNVKVVVDTGGKTLKNILAYKPFLIKPNHHELGDLFGVEIKDRKEAIMYAAKIHEQGVENIIVSLAGDGALLYSSEGVYVAKAPKGEVKNSVGAGDSLVAGFLAGYSISGNVKEALQYGVAAGSATAFSNDLCQKFQVQSLLEKINIEVV